MSGAQISADVAQLGRRVRAGVPSRFQGPLSAGARLMLRFRAVAAPTSPTRDSTTVGSAKLREYSSGPGMSVRLTAPAVLSVETAIGTRSARAERTARTGTDQRRAGELSD